MDIELSAEEISLLEQIKADLIEIGNDRSKLIPILQLVQQKFAYLPGEAIHLAHPMANGGRSAAHEPLRRRVVAECFELPEQAEISDGRA